MSYEFYKILHIFSVMILFTAIGTLAADATGKQSLRRLAGIAHGLALAIIFVAGFGLLAKLKLFGAIPAWAFVKIGIWLLLGLAPIALRRWPDWRVWVWSFVPVLGGIAAWLAVKKPF